MINPASDKVLALSVVANEAMVQGSVLALTDNGDGRLKGMKATATTDVTDFGAFLAYFITPDSEDLDFTGAPGTTTFTINADTGVGGGTHTIASGSEIAALGGSKIGLVRVDINSLYNVSRTISDFPAGTQLKVHTTDALLALDADDDLNVVAGLVVQNDGAHVVVLLA